MKLNDNSYQKVDIVELAHSCEGGDNSLIAAVLCTYDPDMTLFICLTFSSSRGGTTQLG